MTYTEIRHKIEDLNVEINNIERDCINARNTWEEFVSKSRTLKEEVFNLQKELRLKQTPELTFGKDWNGQLMPMEDFKKFALERQIDDKSGHGFYCSQTGKSNIEILPSDVIADKVRTDFDFVLWIAHEQNS